MLKHPGKFQSTDRKPHATGWCSPDPQGTSSGSSLALTVTLGQSMSCPPDLRSPIYKTGWWIGVSTIVLCRPLASDSSQGWVDLVKCRFLGPIVDLWHRSSEGEPATLHSYTSLGYSDILKFEQDPWRKQCLSARQACQLGFYSKGSWLIGTPGAGGNFMTVDTSWAWKHNNNGHHCGCLPKDFTRLQAHAPISSWWAKGFMYILSHLTIVIVLWDQTSCPHFVVRNLGLFQRLSNLPT